MKWCRERLPADDIRAVVINSGNANAATGAEGLANARRTAERAAALLGCRPEQVLVASTGIIGHQLPMDKIEAGTRPGRRRACRRAARRSRPPPASIMTTDTRPKIVSQRQTIAGRDVTLLGIAKGAAMIGPRMATMLGVSADRRPALGQRPPGYPRRRGRALVQLPVGRGARQHQRHRPPALEHGRRPSRSCEATTSRRSPGWCARHAKQLARAIADDGEGATHFITIDVEGCETLRRRPRDRPGRRRQPAGEDRHSWRRPQLGPDRLGRRIRRRPFEEEELSLWINDVAVYQDGMPVPFDDAALSRVDRSRSATCSCGCG